MGRQELMRGVDPQAALQRVAAQLDSLQTRAAIEEALDELEYLFEIIDPEFQEGATYLITELRARLGKLNGKP